MSGEVSIAILHVSHSCLACEKTGSHSFITMSSDLRSPQDCNTIVGRKKLYSVDSAKLEQLGTRKDVRVKRNLELDADFG